MVARGLRRQAELLATLDHPNIIRPVEVGDAQGHGFFSAIEYAEGGCLADKLCAGPVTDPEAASTARAMASALHHARLRGAAPVDLNPGSVLLGEKNAPKLSDFQPTGTRCNGVTARRLLTTGYAAPEELSNSQPGYPDAITDVYRVGAVMYAMLTGQPPFSQTEGQIGTIRQVLEQAPAPVRQRNPVVPAGLEAICMRCLEKQPGLRYASLEELMDALDRVLARG
jgi:serine/threonine-protein kinase